MKKRPLVAVLNTVETNANDHVIEDATLGQWGIKKSSTGNELLLGMYNLAALKTIETFPPVAENPQVAILGASATKDVITASTRYKIEIGNPDDKYESYKKFPVIHAYTTAAALSGDPDTDRLNVYTALASKVNAYPSNNATAYVLDEFDFTLGGDTADGTVITPGTVLTQADSGATAVVAKAVLSTGAWADDDGVGTIWVYNVTGTIDDAVARAWTGGTFTLTSTITTLVEATGLVIADDAGYFVSSIGRNGANWVGATQGFLNSQFELAEAPVYAEGIGSVLAALAPRYDQSKQEAIYGSLDAELVDGAAFDTAKTYKKYVFNWLDGGENALSAEREHAYSQVILYADAAATLTQLETDIAALLT